MKQNKPEILLAIETAIGGGSYGIFDENGEIDSMCNQSRRSKAEDLLSDISLLLKRNGINKNEINKIIFSNGPGSQTGIRIGAATAKGLASALNCLSFEISVLNALVFKAKQKGTIQTAVQISKNDVCRQVFEFTDSAKALVELEIVKLDEFIDEIKIDSNISETIFLSGWLDEHEQIRENYEFQCFETTENIARLMYLAFGK